MHNLWSDLCKRHQDERSFVQPWMRDRCTLLVYDGLSQQQHVQIDDPRRVRRRAHPADIRFDFQQNLDQFGGP